VGHFKAPLDLPPSELCKWEGRFDDPYRAFRTLYCAASPLTALRETLAPFRPSLKTIRELKRFRVSDWRLPPGDWRRKRALAPALLEILSGELLHIDNPGLRAEIALELDEGLLRKVRVEHLDLGEVQGSQRPLTQAIARVLYDRGAAGIIFSSRYDNQPCAALFEERARLVPAGPSLSLREDFPDFVQVCKDFHLS
jgi:hypothetical protein